MDHKSIVEAERHPPKAHTHDDRYYSEAEVDALLNNLRTVVMHMSFPGAYMDALVAGDDLIEKIQGGIFEWKHTNATLITAEAIHVANDTGASSGTINVEIGGVEALSSDISCSETEQTGTINTAADDVTTGDRVEVTVVTAGTNGDAEDLTVRLVWRIA